MSVVGTDETQPRVFMLQSLRGALLTAGYGCTALSAISMAGLLALATQLGPEDTS